MSSPEQPDWIGPALGAAGTIIAGWLAWLGVRFSAKTTALVAKPDPQAVQNEGWEGLLDQMRKELVAASRERNHLNKVLEEERRQWRTERETWRVEREAEREEWHLERETFLGRINQLQAVAEGFERLLRRAMAGEKVNLKERPILLPDNDPMHEPAKIVETTLRQDSLPSSDD